MNRTLKVFIACFLGGGIGALVALQLTFYFWWIGMLVGGLVGYLSYEFNAVLQAIPKAWRKATTWRPDWDYWKAYWKAVSVGWGYALLVCLTPASALWGATYLLWKLGAAIDGIGALTIFGALFLAVAVLAPPAEIACCPTSEWPGRWKNLRKLAIMLNPVSVFFWWLPLGIWKLVLLVPAGIRKIGRGISSLLRFFWYLFRFIHSEFRLLCALDAALGAGIGFFTGSPLIGALAGGVIGILNFEILSKRVLHFVPVGNNQ